MKKLLLFTLLIGLLWSCSSPLDRPYNSETAEEDMKAIGPKLDTSEFFILAGTILRMEFSGEKIKDMSYRDLLDKGKQWKAEQDKIEAEQKAAREKALKEEADRIQRLSGSVQVTCISKSFAEYDYQEYITYKFAIENKTAKAIRAIKGSIAFNNLFDEEIKSFDFVYDHQIEPMKQVFWNAQTDYNQFIENDVALRNKALENLKVVWRPLKIIFVDGTTLE